MNKIDYNGMSDEQLMDFLMFFEHENEDYESTIRLLPYATMYDMGKIRSVLKKIEKKVLIAIYPGEEKTDTSGMEYVGSIPDGELFIK